MIRPDETRIEGHWGSNRGCAVRDANCHRIVLLVTSHLRRLAAAEEGRALFLDPADGRLWELTFPHAGMRGGGPPDLRTVSREEASRRYPPGSF